MLNRVCSLIVCILLLAPVLLDAQPASNTQSLPAGADAELASKQFRVPPGFQIQLFAAEPQFANPVAFTIDDQGKFYVAETYRHSAVGAAFRLFEGVFDVRSHMDWLEDDLAARSVADRVAMYRKHLSPADFAKLSRLSEQVRLLEDRDGDGRAEFSTVFAAGFNRPEDGIGAGVLAVGTNVYFTCIPHLWQLRDLNGDGRADQRTSLHDGYGVHVGFLGHDLHGLTLGPDGLLYFSIGDRGINVTNQEGRVLSYPDEGVVLRCELDGAKLEVFHRGLRNPQELVFNESGDLFTADNNSDGGDRARWVHLVEGGDSGWRIGYQHLTAPPRRGPWNGEQLWRPWHEGQPAWINPPLANLGYGPSGLAYHPSVGADERYARHFFLCDFRGGASSGIHSFTLRPKGASFELASYDPFVWECLPTDVAFGPDGSLYFSDWVQGWNKTGLGRIYRVFDPANAAAPDVREVKALLHEGVAKRTTRELLGLLGHRDQRIRSAAQFELARRGGPSVPLLAQTAAQGKSVLERVHALWALGQIARKTPDLRLDPLLPLLRDPDAEVRAQTARVLGETRRVESLNELVSLLNDASLRVRLFAALAVGKVCQTGETTAPNIRPTARDLALRGIFEMLRENRDADPFLRHAGVQALAWMASEPELRAQSTATSKAVRLAAVLALRKLESATVAAFLDDQDSGVLLEAARAIADIPITSGLPELAALLAKPGMMNRFAGLDALAGARTNAPVTGVEAAVSAVVTETGSWSFTEQFYYRVMNANLRAGGPAHAADLASFAARKTAPASVRIAALQVLGEWGKPSNVDRVTGLWRPIVSPRDAETAITALKPVMAALLVDSVGAVRIAALQAVEKLGDRGMGREIGALVGDGTVESAVRVQALRTMAALKDSGAAEALQNALRSDDAALRREAARLEVESDPSAAVARLIGMLESGSVRDAQAAFSILAGLKDSRVDEVLERWMERLLAGNVSPEVELDLLTAAGQRSSRAVLDRVQAFERSRPKTFTGPFREALLGGDVAEGRRLFFEREDIGCSKCHTLRGQGGQAGPDLTGIGSKKDRNYLLESIVFPNARFADGWENVLVIAHDGTPYAGLLKSETEESLEIHSPEDGVLKVRKQDIKSRTRALSAMPDEFRQILSKQDLRNLIAYLSADR
jgi:quinoprotein glucose dehydrogenase